MEFGGGIVSVSVPNDLYVTSCSKFARTNLNQVRPDNRLLDPVLVSNVALDLFANVALARILCNNVQTVVVEEGLTETDDVLVREGGEA